jgi:hypothetical protein
VLRHLDASEVVIAEAALGALVWSDRPDGFLVVGARRLWDVPHHARLPGLSMWRREVDANRPTSLPPLLGNTLHALV